MRRFNPEKELYKIQNGNKNKILYGIILLLLIISIGSTYALYQVRYSKRIIYTKIAPFSNKDIQLAVFLDDNPTDDFPERNSGYRYDHIECDNDSTAKFDTGKWQLILRAGTKDKCNVYFVKEEEGVPNVPELYQGLIPVVYDASGNISVADTTIEWYNYDEKKWANAVLVDSNNYSKYVDVNTGEYLSKNTIPMSEILQMYVWIPRYKYQLFNVNNGSIYPQEIQIQFEPNTISSGDTTCSIASNGTESCTNAENGKWYTHPAFTFGNTELKGIWVGKFEPSGTNTSIKIIPNVVPILNVNLSYMFNATRSIEETYSANFNINPDEIDTHLMKNMEWGAMAYLTHSRYGRCDGQGKCTEVTRNAQEYKTGYNHAGNLWYTSAGQLASTTGNMYGIYDTNGSAWEYVMGVLFNHGESDIHYSNSGFAKGFFTNKEKYYDLYEYDASEATHARGHLGDATRETLKTFGDVLTGEWYNDYAAFPNSTNPWFRRGGRGGDEARAGVFAFNQRTGEALANHSFRVVLTAQDGDS